MAVDSGLFTGGSEELGRLEAGTLLADAWLAGKTVEFPDDLLPAERAEAYAVQDGMAEILAAEPGNRVVGWKVGATSPGVQRAEGYDGPIPGRVFASTVFGSGAEIPMSRCRQASIEAEIAFRFWAAPSTEDGQIARADVADCVEALPAFDITGTRYAPRTRSGWDGRRKMLAGIADNGNGGAIVIGSPLPDWEGVDFGGLAVELRVNCGEAAPNLRGDARGDPLDALVWTLDHIHARGFAVAAGDIVLTGSLAQPQPFGAGDRAVCSFADLGQSISCQAARA